MLLAECNSVQLLWVLGHKGIEGNGIADEWQK
jgi:ribonuclease HI